MSAIVFDTETTGTIEPRLIEVAWLRVDNPLSLNSGESFVCRYNPGKPIEMGALSIHHIMDEDLVNCPPPDEFKLPAGVEYIIGHNVDFDWGVIGKPSVKRICTLALSRFFWPTLDSHSLGAMLYHIDRQAARGRLRDAHTADRDVANCLHLLSALILGKMPGLTSWEDVWMVSEKAHVPSFMPFGKHKGIAMKDVPSDYKRWLLGQPDVDPYLVQALRGGAR